MFHTGRDELFRCICFRQSRESTRACTENHKSNSPQNRVEALSQKELS